MRPIAFGLSSALSLILLGSLAAQKPRQGEVNTPPARNERHPTTLRAGDVAPDFTLPDQTGKKEVTLSSFKGKKPVVLIFGSHT
jgi:cytochrome oxidase Cu insertion factor (SCO1/SenC/PrrC family)